MPVLQGLQGLAEIQNSEICLCISLKGGITEHQGYCSQTTNMIFFSKNCIWMLWVKAERGEQQNILMTVSEAAKWPSQRTNDNSGLEKRVEFPLYLISTHQDS